MNNVDPQGILSTRTLIEVGVQADEVRRRMHGTKTTFVRVLEVEVQEGGAELFVESGTTVGEYRLVGRPPTPSVAVMLVSMVAETVKAHRTFAGSPAPVTGFSMADLRRLVSDLPSFGALCRELRAKGLEAIAEVPVDADVNDVDVHACVSAARDAGLGVWRLTVHELPAVSAGAVDPRIAIVERAKALQDAVGGFRAFAPLPRTMSITTPTTGYDDVKLVALARLVVTNIESIQVDWPLYGPKLAQVALTMGADDVDGIAAGENGALGTRRSAIEEIKGNIRAAGLEAVERNGRHERIDTLT
jgi:hypothetical protein